MLEGKRLERVQLLGVLLLVVIVDRPPAVLDPRAAAAGRRRRAARTRRFVGWGDELFATTADGGFNCAGCHGGMKVGGGRRPVHHHRLRPPVRSRPVNWYAPALNTIFYRFDESEVQFILVYGRPFSPMSPWGVAGGGPMNDQQIDTAASPTCRASRSRARTAARASRPADVRRRHLPADEAAGRSTRPRADARRRRQVRQLTWARRCSTSTSTAAPTRCARCHTPGWSYGDPGVAGQGAFGWNLTGGSPAAHFPERAGHDRLHQERLRARRQVRHPGPGQRTHAGLRRPAHRRADRGHRRIRAEPRDVERTACAIGWEPELRGILTVIIARRRPDGQRVPHPRRPTSAPGSGSSSRSPVSPAGCSLMGAIWWTYGIGLKGRSRRGRRCRARTVLQDTEALQRGRGARGHARRSRRVDLHRPGGRASSTPSSPRAGSSSPESAPAFGQAGVRRRRCSSRSRRRSPPASSGHRRVRDRWRALPEVRRRSLRLPRLPARAALRRSSRWRRSCRCAPNRAARRRRPEIDESQPAPVRAT